MKKVLVILLMACFAANSVAAEFVPNPVSVRRISVSEQQTVLFDHGKVMFEVVVQKNAYPAARMAASELANFLGKCLKQKITVVSRKSGKVPALIVGDAELARQNGMNVSKLDRDGFYIRTIGKDILIVGADSPKPVGIWTERASLFAAYDFLERFAGIRFYFPGDTGTVTPHKTVWKIPAKIDIVDRPDFQYRRLYMINHEPVSGKKGRVLWYEAAKNPMDQYRLAEYRARMQTRDIPNSHGLIGLGLPKRFSKTHPEYFALNASGKRMDGSEWSHRNDAMGQICFSSKGLQNEIYADAKAILTNHPEQRPGMLDKNGKSQWHPNFRNLQGMGEFFCVMPNDSAYLCRCPECQKHFKDNDPQKISEYIWRFMSGIADRAKAEKLPGYVTTVAYSLYRPMPSFDLPDNMIVMLALTGPWNEGKPVQKKDENILHNWCRKLRKKTYLWTYPGKYWVTVPNVPNMAPNAFAAFYQRQTPYIFGAFAEAETDQWIFGYLNYYVFGKIMWDKNTDIHALLEEHHRLMFGNAASEMAEFFRTLEDHWINEICGKETATPLGPKLVYPSDKEIWEKIYTKQERKRIGKLFETALEKTANDPDSQKRVRFMQEKLWLPICCDAEKYAKLNDDTTCWNEVMHPLSPKDKITIDGKMDEAVWKKIKPFYLLPKNGANNDQVAAYTLCRAAYDAENFYFHIRAMEPKTSEMISSVRKQDGTVWEDNCLEIFLADSITAKNAYQWIINSSGSLFDQKFSREYGDVKWNSAAKYKTRIEQGKHWELEIRIPRKNLSFSGKESVAANFTRFRHVKDEVKTWDVWSPYIVNKHSDIAKFGTLLFRDRGMKNILDTPDFDKPVYNNRFIGKWFSGKAMPVDKKTFRTAGVCVMLKKDNEHVGQSLPQLKPNTAYRVSFYIKTQDVKPLKKNAVGAYLRIEQGNKKPAILPHRSSYMGTMPWTRQCFEFKTGELQTHSKPVYLRFSLHKQLATGTVWIDHVVLEEIK